MLNSRFGVFELDLNNGELCRNGRKLRLQEQPFRLPQVLIKEPGQTITRDKLKEVLWPTDTFVDFDHGLNAAVAKLRLALGDSAENPRFIETVARRGYLFIAPVEFAGNAAGEIAGTQNDKKEDSVVAAPLSTRAEKKIGLPVWMGAAVVTALALLAVWWWRGNRPVKIALAKLTDDSGLTVDFCGRKAPWAYASDRESHGNLNVWIQQLGPGGRAVQLTHDQVDTDEPAFSPDGARIAFH